MVRWRFTVTAVFDINITSTTGQFSTVGRRRKVQIAYLPNSATLTKAEKFSCLGAGLGFYDGGRQKGGVSTKIDPSNYGGVATQKKPKKNRKKPVPNFKFAVAFGFFRFFRYFSAFFGFFRFFSLVLNRSPIIFKNFQIRSKSEKEGRNRRIFS